MESCRLRNEQRLESLLISYCYFHKLYTFFIQIIRCFRFLALLPHSSRGVMMEKS
jgi:hypothetical protein